MGETPIQTVLLYNSSHFLFVGQGTSLHHHIYHIVLRISLGQLSSLSHQLSFGFLRKRLRGEAFDEGKEIEGGDLCFFNPLHEAYLVAGGVPIEGSDKVSRFHFAIVGSKKGSQEF